MHESFTKTILKILHVNVCLGQYNFWGLIMELIKGTQR